MILESDNSWPSFGRGRGDGFLGGGWVKVG